jgi:hypothetical protein
MPKPFALISSCDIQEQEFFDVLRTTGGVIEDASALAGRISRDEQHVWVSLDHSLLKDYEADEIALISQKLEGKPRSSSLLDVSRTAGSEQLAVAFAAVCVQRWPCVVYNLRDKVFTAHELLQLQKMGGGFEE